MSTYQLPTQIISLPQVTQQTDSHCGPAVIQSLYAFLNKEFTQDEIVHAARVKRKIIKHGTRPDQLGRAVAKLTPEFTFWYKQQTSIQDLKFLIHGCHWPVAVNWQGLFYETEEEQLENNPDGDHGHYSVAVGINDDVDEIIIADPYAEFSVAPRVFSLKWFENRWWDYDMLIDKKSGKKDKIHTKRMIFLITPKEYSFPEKIGMTRMHANGYMNYSFSE